MKIALVAYYIAGLLLLQGLIPVRSVMEEKRLEEFDTEYSENSADSERVYKRAAPKTLDEKKLALKEKLIRLTDALKKLQEDAKEEVNINDEPQRLARSEFISKENQEVKGLSQISNERKAPVNLMDDTKLKLCNKLKKYWDMKKRELAEEGQLRLQKRNSTGEKHYHNCSQTNGARLEELLTQMNEAEVRVNLEVAEVNKYKELAKDGQKILAEKAKFLKAIAEELRESQSGASEAAKAAQEAQDQVLLHDKKLCKARHEVDRYLKEILEIEGNICSLDACGGQQKKENSEEHSNLENVEENSTTAAPLEGS